jgi:chromosome segregation ATPase
MAKTVLPQKAADASKSVEMLDQQIDVSTRALAQIDQERERVMEALRMLRRARSELLTAERRRQRRAERPRNTGPRTAAQRAGSGNVDAVRAVMRSARAALPKPTIKQRAAAYREVESINDGTITYAIQALVDSGELRQVGVTYGSRVYEYVSRGRSGSTVSRPGDR